MTLAHFGTFLGGAFFAPNFGRPGGYYFVRAITISSLHYGWIHLAFCFDLSRV